MQRPSWIETDVTRQMAGLWKSSRNLVHTFLLSFNVHGRYHTRFNFIYTFCLFVCRSKFHFWLYFLTRLPSTYSKILLVWLQSTAYSSYQSPSNSCAIFRYEKNAVRENNTIYRICSWKWRASRRKWKCSKQSIRWRRWQWQANTRWANELLRNVRTITHFQMAEFIQNW